MNQFVTLLSATCALAIGVGVMAYFYGYVFRARGFRPLHAVTLCSTVMALAQLMLSMQGGPEAETAHVSATFFVVVATFAQAVVAVRGRKARAPFETADTAPAEPDAA
ncbi:hypothetical protein [Phenylobacterium sp.]|uniref:hypothetical protein n=1 Tax=Phenylobacterium sp. TaxID=1871053 RepID=UPI0027360AF0|nr:hypothetical protein [Phenylobacterium sp.]MDP3660925.1 hypothetical protein [Phenylobacterium sp.]